MFEDAFGLHEAATIRAAVNKSLEQGIVTEDLAAREQPLIKQVILRLASLIYKKYTVATNITRIITNHY
jgi:isocitrate/isopropylmalate dehydrogenase